jgi:hypothetical protein
MGYGGKLLPNGVRLDHTDKEAFVIPLEEALATRTEFHDWGSELDWTLRIYESHNMFD